MFNKSIFGTLGDEFKADRNGFVPEPGDRQEDFDYGRGFTPEEWEELVAENFSTAKRLESLPS